MYLSAPLFSAFVLRIKKSLVHISLLFYCIEISQVFCYSLKSRSMTFYIFCEWIHLQYHKANFFYLSVSQKYINTLSKFYIPGEFYIKKSVINKLSHYFTYLCLMFCGCVFFNSLANTQYTHGYTFFLADKFT